MPIKKVSMSNIRQRYTKLPINRKWLLIALIVLILSFFFKINIFAIVFLVIFFVANAILLSLDRYISAPIDLELSTFSAVLMTTRYGLQWGIAAAVLTKIAAILYNKNFTIDHLFMIGGYIVAAFMASVFHGTPIILLGIIATIITNIYIVFVSKFITMLPDMAIMTYGASNTIFNIVMFVGFAEIFLKLMI
jgi:hypothetical protein